MAGQSGATKRWKSLSPGGSSMWNKIKDRKSFDTGKCLSATSWLLPDLPCGICVRNYLRFVAWKSFAQVNGRKSWEFRRIFHVEKCEAKS